MITFQDVIISLQKFWINYGCILLQPTDIEVGAGTLNRHTFLKVLDSASWNVIYVEPCRRPGDGRYGNNKNRLQHFYQFQVILKPCPLDVQKLYLKSLEFVGFDLIQSDVRFIEDDWSHPCLGANGLGWEVWVQGMEITQFTYFQQCGGLILNKTTCEITYGLERLLLCLQQVDSIFDIIWGVFSSGRKITYGDIHKKDEYEWSCHNFNRVDINMCIRHFNDYEYQSKKLLKNHLVRPAYDYILKCSHLFNLMMARGFIGINQRVMYISRIRHLSKICAETFLKYGSSDV